MISAPLGDLRTRLDLVVFPPLVLRCSSGLSRRCQGERTARLRQFPLLRRPLGFRRPIPELISSFTENAHTYREPAESQESTMSLTRFAAFMKRGPALLLLALVPLLNSALFAQITNATLTGTIKDATGAVVPHAK